MEELLIEFEKNGAVKSIVANYIWKWGCAIATIWYLIKVLVLGEDKMSVWIMFLGIIILLFILSFCISIKEISRKVHKKITIKAIWGELINQGRINTTLKFEILLREIGTKEKRKIHRFSFNWNISYADLGENDSRWITRNRILEITYDTFYIDNHNILSTWMVKKRSYKR